MSLIDDVKLHYEHESYPPDGPDLDYAYVDGKWVEKDTSTELVSNRTVGNLRWGTQFVNVYKRDSEYVAVSDVRPATEMQDWGDYGEPDIYKVRPVEVTTIEYEKIEA